ncbi:MAG: hypothetical protein K9G60_08555 [Pseudolabrys sp.]|nr:hypothetical protein [Pseudolabrys sp.]
MTTGSLRGRSGKRAERHAERIGKFFRFGKICSIASAGRAQNLLQSQSPAEWHKLCCHLRQAMSFTSQAVWNPFSSQE